MSGPFPSAGVFVTEWVGDGQSGDANFSTPHDVAVAPDGSVYVPGRGSNRIQKFTPDGVFVTEWGTYGTGDGQFRDPWGVGGGARRQRLRG
jgi:DNA-binding beta-propeller fold protein YncE